MNTPFVLALVAHIASTGSQGQLDVENLKITANVIEIGLVDYEAVQQIEKHVLGKRLVVFFPRMESHEVQRQFTEGPVTTLRVLRVAKGTVMTLVSRVSGQKLLEMLRFNNATKPSLRTDKSLQVMPTTNSVVIPEIPKVSSSLQPLSKSLVSPTSAESIRVGALLLFFVLVGAGGLIVVRRGKGGRVVGHESIEVVAVKPLGPKQRLTLVETCGSRLLLATNGADVRLLGNLGVARSEAFSETLKKETEREVLAETPADVAGLMRLRNETQTPVLSFAQNEIVPS